MIEIYKNINKVTSQIVIYILHYNKIIITQGMAHIINETKKVNYTSDNVAESRANSVQYLWPKLLRIIYKLANTFDVYWNPRIYMQTLMHVYNLQLYIQHNYYFSLNLLKKQSPHLVYQLFGKRQRHGLGPLFW